MSVRVIDRNEGKLQVLDDMRKLYAHTLTICKNESAFPKSWRWLMTQKIVNECADAYLCIRRANSLYYENKDELVYSYRHSQQKEAYAHLEALLGLIDMAEDVLGLPSKRIETWVGLVTKVEKTLSAWTKSDTERFNKL